MEIQKCKKCIVKTVCEEPCDKITKAFKFYTRAYSIIEILFVLMGGFLIAVVVTKQNNLTVVFSIISALYFTGMSLNTYFLIQRNYITAKFSIFIMRGKTVRLVGQRPIKPPPKPPKPPVLTTRTSGK